MYILLNAAKADCSILKICDFATNNYSYHYIYGYSMYSKSSNNKKLLLTLAEVKLLMQTGVGLRKSSSLWCGTICLICLLKHI